jgi:hypothetical protein
MWDKGCEERDCDSRIDRGRGLLHDVNLDQPFGLQRVPKEITRVAVAELATVQDLLELDRSVGL